MTSIVEIAPDVYRLCTYNPDSGLQFCQFLFKDDQPLLFHTGHRRLFEGVREAVARVIDPAAVRWIGHSHFEADECGSLNEWLEIAPQAQAFCSVVGARTSVSDFAIRPLARCSTASGSPQAASSFVSARLRMYPTAGTLACCSRKRRRCCSVRTCCCSAAMWRR